MIDYEKAYKDLQTLYVQWLSATVSTDNGPLEELLYDISLVIEGNYPDDMQQPTNKRDIVSMAGQGTVITSINFNDGLEVTLTSEASAILQDWFVENKDFTKNPKSKIYKYTLPVKDGYQEVELPQYAYVVAVEAHPEVGNVINFWAQFDEEDEANKETHTFLTVGTGQRFSNAYHHYVWHLLEVRS